jgi:hypothetical protein
MKTLFAHLGLARLARVLWLIPCLALAAADPSPVLEVTLRRDTELRLGGAGRMKMPGGGTLRVLAVDGDRLKVAVGSIEAFVAIADTDYAERKSAAPISPVVPKAAASPSDPLALADAIHIPLPPEARVRIIREVWQRRSWAEASQRLGNALLADFTSGNVDRPPWEDRLWLARIFHFLGQAEAEAASAILDGLIRKDGQRVGAAEIRQNLDHPGLRDVGEKFLGDAENWPRPGLVGERLDAETAVALLSNPELVSLLARHLSPLDYQPGVWRVLGDLQANRPQLIAEQPRLAVALAIVYDRGLPSDWPHGQVERDAVPIRWGNWKEMADYFLAAQKAGRLAFDLSKLSVDQLKFLIDAPLDQAEFAWAAENIKIPPRDFERAFRVVEYDTGRIKSQQYDWPGKIYTLEEIRKADGICVDQAYFACIAGKARGIPTLYFRGQGRDGGHAWFGFLRGGDWLMDAGRYEQQNYESGEAWDPQTWLPINDHQLRFISSLASERTHFKYSRKMLILCGLPLTGWDAAKRRKAFDIALESCPDLPETWLAIGEILETSGERAALASHLRGMARQFEKMEDVKALAQAWLAETEAKLGNTHRAEQLQASATQGRSDLASRAAYDLVAALLEAKQYEQAYEKYAGLLRQFKDPGGDLFYTFVRPTVVHLHRAGETGLARRALDRARNHFPASEQPHSSPFSLLAQEFAELDAFLGDPPAKAAASD